MHKRYIGIEDWTYGNIIKDLKVGGAQEVRKGKLVLNGQFYTFHHNSCTIELVYSGQKNLDLIIWGGEDKANEILKSLGERIENYNEKYCDAKGLLKSIN
jgi:hypothetical protein